MKKLFSFLKKNPAWVFSTGVVFALSVTVLSIAFLASSASTRIAIMPRDAGDNTGVFAYLYRVSYEVFYEIESRLYYPGDTWACKEVYERLRKAYKHSKESGSGVDTIIDTMTPEEEYCSRKAFRSRDFMEAFRD